MSRSESYSTLYNKFRLTEKTQHNKSNTTQESSTMQNNKTHNDTT